MMCKINSSPMNKEHYLKLIEFGKEVCSAYGEIGVEPIAYGSLMFFAYTKDEKTKVNDLDFLVPEKSFNKIIKELKKKGIKTKYVAKWHMVQAFKGDLKIELDSIDFWQPRLSKNYEDFNFKGLRVRGVSLISLMKIYKYASEVSEDNSEGNRRKYEILRRVGK